MNSKELLLNQLTDLHTTMMEVHKRNQQLNMCAWITKLSGTEDDAFCGFAACWCGWQSLGNLDNFTTANDYQGVTDDQEGIARRVSDDLDKACSDVFGHDGLSMSIYEASMEDRRYNAEASGLFNTYELNHIHLRSENPTPLEAASYALLCIEKVKNA